MIRTVNEEVLMNSIKLTTTIALALLVATSFAAGSGKVKSKIGNLELTKQKDGGSVNCTVDFNEELTLVREDGADAFVKGACGTGWVPKSKIEYVAKGPGDKSLKVEPVDIRGWIDNPTAVFVLQNEDVDFDGVEINRDFKEYLAQTMDREQMEMRNGEN